MAALAWIEIALGVLAGGVGTVALKKVVELMTEDLYKCAKNFVKAYILHRKANEWNASAELHVTFELERVEFIACTSSIDENEILLTLQSIRSLIAEAEKILTSRHLPEGIVLELQESGDKKQEWNSNRELPESLDTVWFDFNSKRKKWVVRAITVDRLKTFWRVRE